MVSGDYCNACSFVFRRISDVLHCFGGPGSVDGIATAYGPDGPGIDAPGQMEAILICPQAPVAGRYLDVIDWLQY